MITVTPKYKLILYKPQNVIKAIQVLNELTGIDYKALKYFITQFPQPFSTLEPERFCQVVFTESELKEVTDKLNGIIDYFVIPLNESTVGVGNFPPWGPEAAGYTALS